MSAPAYDVAERDRLQAAHKAAADALAKNLDPDLEESFIIASDAAYDAWADFASANGLCYYCGGVDDTDGRDTACSTCDPEAAADRAREDAEELARVAAAEAAALAAVEPLPPIDPDIDWNAYYVQEGRHEGTPCAVCGREVTGPLFIEWHADGILIVPIGTSGEYPQTAKIGPECARRFPEAYVGGRP